MRRSEPVPVPWEAARMPSLLPARRVLLQRQCACGDTPVLDEACEACRVQSPGVQHQDVDAGAPSDASGPGAAAVSNDAGASTSERDQQVSCVIRLGGCPNTQAGGFPTLEEIASYNRTCRSETAYTGPDVTPSDVECRNPPHSVAPIRPLGVINHYFDNVATFDKLGWEVCN